MHLCFRFPFEAQTCVTYHSRRFNAAEVELIGRFASHPLLPIRPYFIPRTLSDDRPVNAGVALPQRGHRPNETEIKPRQGVVANTLDLFRNGAVGFIDWLGRVDIMAQLL